MKAGSMGIAAGVQFLSRKEPGRLRRSRRGHHQRRRIWPRRCACCAITGRAEKYYHDIEGYNGRLDAIQAGILHVKLKHLEEWNEKRRALAKEYARLLEGVEGVVLPHEASWSKAVYHLYVVRVAEREKLQADLASSGIGTAIHYPIPLHQQKAYQRLGYKTGDFPVAERVAPEIVSLPMFPQLSFEQARQVAEEVIQVTGVRQAAEVTAG